MSPSHPPPAPQQINPHREKKRLNKESGYAPQDCPGSSSSGLVCCRFCAKKEENALGFTCYAAPGFAWKVGRCFSPIHRGIPVSVRSLDPKRIFIYFIQSDVGPPTNAVVSYPHSLSVLVILGGGSHRLSTWHSTIEFLHQAACSGGSRSRRRALHTFLSRDERELKHLYLFPSLLTWFRVVPSHHQHTLLWQTCRGFAYFPVPRVLSLGGKAKLNFWPFLERMVIRWLLLLLTS